MKILITLLTVLVTFSTKAQWNINGSNIYNTNSGNVGIGTTTPASKLNVFEGEIRISATTMNRYLILDAVSAVNIATMISLRRDNTSRWLFGASGNSGTDNFDFFHYSNTGAFLGSALILERSTGNAIFQNDIKWGSGGSMLTTDQGGSMELRGTGGAPYIDFSNDAIPDYDARIILLSNDILNIDGANVGIGTSNPGSFKLAVEGKIGAREVQVTVTNPWPDYVFQEDYRLPSLTEVASFIKKYKHLPDVPTSGEIQKNGHKLGEMDALLLKKIEELTLYMIQLKRENEELKKQMNKLLKRG